MAHGRAQKKKRVSRANHPYRKIFCKTWNEICNLRVLALFLCSAKESTLSKAEQNFTPVSCIKFSANSKIGKNVWAEVAP